MPRKVEQAEIITSEEETKEEEFRLLELRKEIELECVKVYDQGIDENDEFFFIMDTKWLNAWAEFVEGDATTPEPGPISTKDLLDENEKPLSYLVAKIDYRAICPMVYYIFKEFHDSDESPEICRYKCDVHSIQVIEKDYLRVVGKFRMKASAEAKRLRQKWQKPVPIIEEDQKIDCCGCCNITKEHIEACLYWMVMCCARRKDARRYISYSQYQPLQTKKKKKAGGRLKKYLSKLFFWRKKEVDNDFEFDDGKSVIDDDNYSVGNPEEGHYESGHWLRNMLSTNESVLK
jgi:hypothetical protein